MSFAAVLSTAHSMLRAHTTAHAPGLIEVGECGLAHREVLAAAGLPAAVSGLAMGEPPAPARHRIGMLPRQYNVLVRIVLRPLDRTLTSAEANELRDRVYAALHEARHTSGRADCGIATMPVRSLDRRYAR